MRCGEHLAIVVSIWTCVCVGVLSISSLPLEIVEHTVGAITQPFATALLPAPENRDARGLTVQIMYEDCLDQVRFTLVTNLTGGLVHSRDRRLCALFVYPAERGRLVAIGALNFVLRGLRMYATSASASSSPLRVGWIYWHGYDFLVGTAEPQLLYYCPKAGSPFVDSSVARGACATWMSEPGTTTGILACPFSERIQLLIDYLRRKDGRAMEYTEFTNLPIGYITWIGHFGQRTVWDSGRFLSWNHFRPGHPTGDFPTVLDETNRWRSVLATRKHAYCCESTGNGNIARYASGMISIKLRMDEAELESATSNLTMNYDSVTFFPFRSVYLNTEEDISVYGFTAAFSGTDCDGTFRFVTPSVAPVPTLRYSHRVDLCQVMVRPVIEAAPTNSSAINTMLRSIQVVSVSTDRRPAVGAAGAPRRVVWMYWIRDPTPLFVTGAPRPHGYFCRHASVESRTALEMCAAYGGGLEEAYLVTLQTRWEEDFVQQLRGEVAFFDDIWIGLHSTKPQEWMTGEPLTYDNWGVNQPQRSHSPALMSAFDSSWRTQMTASNHSYCCEFHGVTSRRWSGAFRMTPLGTAPPRLSHTTIGYRAHRKFFPFVTLDSSVSEETRMARVFGVTIQIHRQQCFHPNGTSRAAEYLLQLDGVTLSSPRFFLCPSADSRCAPAHRSLLAHNCMLMLTRDDNLAIEAQNYFHELRGIRFEQEERFVSDGEVRIGWVLWGNSTTRIVADPVRGTQMWCGGPSVAVTFVEAQDFCRLWHGDGFLTTVRDTADNEMLALARNLADNHAWGHPFSASVWIGHQRADPRWMNGDDVRFSRWSPGQPDSTGPTQAMGDGNWRNVFTGSLTGPARASFCCRRNGLNGITRHLVGEVIITGPTPSISVSQTATRLTETETMSTSAQITTAAVIPSYVPTPTTTYGTTTETQTVTENVTLSSSRGTDSMTLTMTRTLSRTLTGSDTTDMTLVPRIDVLGDPGRSNPLEGVVDADAIRGRVASKNRVELRTATFRAVHTNFKAGMEPQFFMDRIKIETRQNSLFGFRALRDTLITAESFIVNSTHLQIVFAQNDVIDIRDDELLTVTFDRDITYLDDDDPRTPSEFPQFTIRLLHGDEATGIAMFFIVLSTALAAIGSPQAFKDQQNMALFGAMKCARAPSRVVYRAGYRIITPLRYGDGLFPAWFGAFAPSYVFFLVHIILLLYRLKSSGRLRRAFKAELLCEVAASIRFPSVSILVMQLLHLGVIFFSVEIFKYTDSLFEMLMGFWGALYSLALTFLILYWSFKYKGMMFFEYTAAEMAHVPPVLKAIIPHGQWGPTLERQMCRWIVGEYMILKYTPMEYFMGGITAGLAAWMPAEIDECILNYTIMGIYYIVCALVVLLLRPFRTYFGSVTCVISYLFLASMMLCGGSMVRDPFGPGATAAHVIRWMQTSLCILRGLVGIAVLRLEHKLISERRKKIKAEAARQEREMKILNVLDDDETYGGAHDASEAAMLLASPHGGKVVDATFGDVLVGRKSGTAPPGPGRATSYSGEGTDLRSRPNPLNIDSESGTLANLSNSHDGGALLIPINRSIYSPERERATSELERRRKLMAILDDSVGARAGHIPEGGVMTVPTWAK